MNRARAGTVAVALLLTACAQTSSPTGSVVSGRHAPTATSKHLLVGATGGSVTLALGQVPTTLNDHTVEGDTADTRFVASAIWPQVFQVGPGQTPTLDTAVVLSAELVGINPQTVVYQINPRAVWSDGVPVSVDDFVYAWQSQKGGALDVDASPDSVASTLGYRDIESVTGSNDGRTVTVVFRTPFGDWASLFDDLLPAHVADHVGWNHGFDTFRSDVLVSGGPWIVASWQPGVRLVLERNPRWWGSRPRLDQIVLIDSGDPNSLLGELRGGSVQVAYPSAFSASTLAALSSSSTLESTESLGTNMLQLVFNTRHAPFDNLDVREGIAHAIDRAGIVTSLLQPIDPSIWEDNNFLFANTQPQYSDDGAGYVQPDLPTADKLLSQGGLGTDQNGTWTFQGNPVTVHLVWAEDDPWSEEVEPTIAAQLTGAGFDVDADAVTSSDLVGAVLPTGAFDLALAPLSASAYPSSTAEYFSSAATLTNPGIDVDWSGLVDKHLDSVLTQAVEELGSNQANPLYHQADQELWSQMPAIPLFAEPTLLVNSASLNGVQDDPGGLGPMFYAAAWYRLVPAQRATSAARNQ